MAAVDARMFVSRDRGGACAPARSRPHRLAELDTSIAAAEDSLRSGEHQIAESRYRTALQQGWMILGRHPRQRRALGRCPPRFRASVHGNCRRPFCLQSLAIVQLQIGETGEALGLLTRMASASPRDIQIRLTLAEALFAAGKTEEAAQELDEVRTRRTAGRRVDVCAGDRVPADWQGGSG